MYKPDSETEAYIEGYTDGKTVYRLALSTGQTRLISKAM